MAHQGFNFFDSLSQRRALRRWALLAKRAMQTPLSHLRQQRTEARALRSHLDRLIHAADERLALPAIGSESFPRPHNTDWAWRPALWRESLPAPGLASVQSRAKLGDDITLFHDCALSELTVRQLRNTGADDLAPYVLRMDVFRFDGSFLSLVIDLPPAATKGLTRDHLLRVNVRIAMERPIEVFARLNIKHGPNTEQIVRELPMNTAETMAEFDLAYSNLNEKRVEKAWIDLIFEGPEMNQVTLRDVTLARHPRAAF